MPVFEYQCKACGHVTEFLEKSDAKGRHECEKCGSTKTEKMFSGFAVKGGESSGADGSSCPTGTCPLN